MKSKKCVDITHKISWKAVCYLKCNPMRSCGQTECIQCVCVFFHGMQTILSCMKTENTVFPSTTLTYSLCSPICYIKGTLPGFMSCDLHLVTFSVFTQDGNLSLALTKWFNCHKWIWTNGTHSQSTFCRYVQYEHFATSQIYSLGSNVSLFW